MEGTWKNHEQAIENRWKNVQNRWFRTCFEVLSQHGLRAALGGRYAEQPFGIASTMARHVSHEGAYPGVLPKGRGFRNHIEKATQRLRKVLKVIEKP